MVMGSVLEGAAALIIFGPLLVPVAVKLGVDPLHFGVVLVIAMGIGLFAPPLGLGLYGACLIGNVPIEQTVKPIVGYLGLLFLACWSSPSCLRSASICPMRSVIDAEERNALNILLTHTPHMRRHYYGERSLEGLQALGDVLLHEGDEALDAAALVAAAKDADIIVADRKTEGPGEIFGKLPKLRAFVRCAVDIRNIDVEAASKAGRAGDAGESRLPTSVSELAIGYMVDLSRGISRATAEYHAGQMPDIVMGRQLAGSTAGIIGYGSIGRHLAPILKALGMKVLVADPYAKVDDPDIKHVSLEELLTQSDYVVCLVVATEETENLMNAAAFARMQPHAVFINLSRGNLVDEAALLAALKARASPAPRWMSAARRTRCPQGALRSSQMSSPRRISVH